MGAGTDVETGMAQGHTINMHSGDVAVEVRLDGEVVARSDRPILLDETGLPTQYYLPREDVIADLRGIALSTHCPFKGDASYWTIKVGDTDHDGIAWSYETPKEGAEQIKGLVAFFSNRAEVFVDGKAT